MSDLTFEIYYINPLLERLMSEPNIGVEPSGIEVAMPTSANHTTDTGFTAVLGKPAKVVRQEQENTVRHLEGKALDIATCAAIGLKDAVEPVSTSKRYCAELQEVYRLSVQPILYVEEDGSMQVDGWSAQAGYDPDLVTYTFSAAGSTPQIAICRCICLTTL